MPSFDVVSEVNIQEVDNAVNQAQKEIAGRYDFKSKKFDIEFDKNKSEIKISADEEGRLNSVFDVLSSKLFKRGVELSSLDVGKKEAVGGMTIKQLIKIKQGLETDIAKNLIKHLKETKLKIEAQIQEKQIRITGKNKDDLQTVMSILKEKAVTLKIPLQFTNLR